MEKLTDEDFIIACNDYLLSIAPETLVFNPYQKMPNFTFDKTAFILSPAMEVSASMNNFSFVVDFAHTKGYIYHPKDNYSNQMFALTDLGRQVKIAGGHNQYWELIKDKESAIFENLKWAKRAAEAAEQSAISSEKSTGYNKTTMILIAVYTALTFILVVIGIFTCHFSQHSKNNQAIAPNSNTEIKAGKAPDTIK